MKTISRYILTLVALFAISTGAWATDDVLLVTITAADNSSFNSGSQTFDNIATVTLSGEVYCFGDENGWFSTSEGTLTVTAAEGYTITRVKFYTKSNSAFDEEAPFEAILVSGMDGVNKIEVYGYAGTPAPAEPAIEVTTNAAEEGATFTEASFEMPTFDATADYELVRDMSYKVAFSGVPTRARLAKDGNGKFHFADGLTFQLLDNIDAANPKDITSAEGITFMVGEVVPFDFEGSTFYQLDKETLVPLADFLADAHLGTYAICAVASTGEYDGSFSSGMITLFQGYEVEVAAKEFITYYKDEPLYADTETSADAELYTITSVSADQATLSAAIETAPSLTPLLIFNNSDEAKTFLLIPANEEPNLALTVAPEFQGTLTARDFTADDMAAADYYTLSGGKIFVPVYEAGTIAANKCWLQFNHQQTPGARTITLVFGDDATGINSMVNGQWPMDTWYDLNGRKLDKMPTKKGIYIKNGKKVVVR